MPVLRHNLSISPSSWHGRWYCYWQSLGGKMPPMENLCHYMRVLLLWAPLRWFFKGRIRNIVPPWLIALGAIVVALIVLAFMIWTSAMIKAAISLGILCLAIALIFGLVLTWSYIDERGHRSATKRYAKRVTMPLWGVPYGLFWASCNLYHNHQQRFDNAGHWFVARRYHGVTPAGAITSGLIVGGLLTWLILNPINFLVHMGILIGSVIAIVVVAVAWTYASELINDHRSSRDDARPRSKAGRLYGGAIDTVKLGVTYAGTKKRGSRICPFITFDKR